MSDYQYLDEPRPDIYRMIPPDGKLIGTIGCGRAATELQLVRDGREVHGVDVSAEAIEVAKSRLTSARVIKPADETPFEANSLDGLILADVLEHMPMAWLRLRRLMEAVKPGGWVVISVPNNRYVEALVPLLFKGDWPEYPLGIFDETHIQVMTHKRLDRWCRDAGLTKEAEFDLYDFSFFKRNVYRAINLTTFRLFRSFLTFEVQARYRKT
ncbi:class I SAM-dependent methyltransferase [Sphingomonas flavescens]|uniref:class I SAM-dependent methyltransferase n=1 Tax=Sphingomonas flavescens TaxID=3132797 RepID=UPI00280483C7|nr:class I SAM-dependent methyltransferase [Sphingomonas limnosediminicola]